LWDRYTYGKKSEINWPEQYAEESTSTINKELELIEIRKQQEKDRMKAGTNELVEVPQIWNIKNEKEEKFNKLQQVFQNLKTK
jgi:hypothetical protein